MITLEIKLHPEPEPVKSAGNDVTYWYNGKKWSGADIEEAINWAKLCGLEIGTVLTDIDIPNKSMEIVGYATNPESVSTYKGRPAIIIMKVCTAVSSYESYFTVDELLDKKYQYFNVIGGC